MKKDNKTETKDKEMYIVRYKVRIKEGATRAYDGKEQPLIYFIGGESQRDSIKETGGYSERREYDSLITAVEFMWFLADPKTRSPKHWMSSDGVTIKDVKLLKEVEV